MKCDYCGRDFYDHPDFFFTGHFDNTINWEWWPKGNYCAECIKKLERSISDMLMPIIPERYQSEYTDEIRKKLEHDFIKAQEDNE